MYLFYHKTSINNLLTILENMKIEPNSITNNKMFSGEYTKEYSFFNILSEDIINTKNYKKFKDFYSAGILLNSNIINDESYFNLKWIGYINENSIKIDNDHFNLNLINKILCKTLKKETLPFPMTHEIMIKDVINLNNSIIKIIIPKNELNKFLRFKLDIICID